RYTSAAQQFDQRPDAALARRRPAGCKGTSGLEGCVPVLAQTPQDRRVEIPECRGLDSIGEHAHEQPSRKMGGSDPAQMVPPLEPKLTLRCSAMYLRDPPATRSCSPISSIRTS